MPLPNTTRIEDLPELSDMESNYNRGNNRGNDKGIGGDNNKGVSKYIRNHKRDVYENTPYDNYNSAPSKIFFDEPEEMIEPKFKKEMFEPSPSPRPQQLNCLDVCNHIRDCPLCSRFYNNDNTLYIIVIVSLLILTIILTKKVLNL